MQISIIPMYYKLSRLMLTPTAARPSTTAEVFIANPQIDQEAILGKLFFILEIESVKPAATKIVQFFAESLPQYYYQSEKITLKEKMGTLNITELFENALTKINAEFAAFCKKEKIKLSAKTLNLACGVVCSKTLAFSTIGSIKILLVHAEQKSDESEKKIYKITPLDEQDSAAAKPNIHKLFASVNEGAIPPEGYVVFTNEILPEYITGKHLTKIITTLPAQSAIEQIKNQLHKINNYVTFAGLIIKNSATPHVQRAIPKLGINVTAHNSLERMQETESETERYLSPVGVIRRAGLGRLVRAVTARLPFRSRSAAPTALRDKIFFARKNRLRVIAKTADYLKTAVGVTTALVLYLLHAVSHPRHGAAAARHHLRRVARITVGAGTAALNWLINLSSLRKTLLGVFVAATLLFGYNIYALVHEKNQARLQTGYQELLWDIRQKQNQIEANLLYENEVGARELLSATEHLITELAGYAIADAKLINELQETARRQLAAVSHVVIINDLREVADISRLNINARAAGLVPLNDTLLVVDTTNRALYRADPATNALTVFAEGDDVLAAGVGAALTDDRALFVNATGGITVSDTFEVAAVTADFAGDNAGLTAAASYNGRLYLLSAAQNRITRFAANFTGQNAWLKEDIDISNAVDLAIDGYIYVLRGNGEIIKMLSGYTNAFRLSEVTPPLEQPAKIKLTGESEDGLLYVLEPARKRIVVFDKQGGFVLQYELPLADAITDFAVLPDTATIAVTAGHKLYEFDAQHLE